MQTLGDVNIMDIGRMNNCGQDVRPMKPVKNFLEDLTDEEFKKVCEGSSAEEEEEEEEEEE